MNNSQTAQHIENRRSSRIRRKSAILEYFGSVCQNCGFADPRALQIDHIHGGGRRGDRRFQETRSGQQGIYGFLFKLIKADDPYLRQNYQLLCANCNWIKRAERNETRKSKRFLGKI
jgi:hypothetical protein